MSFVFSTVHDTMQELFRIICLYVNHCNILQFTSLFPILPKYIFIYLCYKQKVNTEVVGLTEGMPVIIFIWCYFSCGKTFIVPLCQCNTLQSYRSLSQPWIVSSSFLQIKLVIAIKPHHLMSTSLHSFQTATGLWVNYGTF